MSLLIFDQWLFLISKAKLPLNQPKIQNNTQKAFRTGNFNCLSSFKEARVRTWRGSQIISS